MTTLRAQFDPENNFVVTKALIVTSTQYRPDRTKLFDKSLVTVRLLRQLYDQHYLEVADPVQLAPEEPVKRVRRRRFTDGVT